MKFCYIHAKCIARHANANPFALTTTGEQYGPSTYSSSIFFFPFTRQFYILGPTVPITTIFYTLLVTSPSQTHPNVKAI